MPARSMGTGSISFGLVAIPVKLYPATQPSAGVSFNLLDKESGSRLKQQYIRPSDGQVVPRDQMVKGYEFAKDQYVVFTTDEIKALEEKSTQSIDITEFVPLAAVDPVYFDKPYYLSPERGGDKAYRLLSAVMQETGRCAIARYAARGKQYLVLIRPIDKGLVMQQLLYSDEVRPFAEVPIPDGEVKETELKLARQLVEQIAHETFNPAAYEDDVRKRIMADIQRKIEGKEIEVAETQQEPAQIIDLMEALKASLAAGTGKRRSGKPEPTEVRRPAKRSLDEAQDEPHDERQGDVQSDAEAPGDAPREAAAGGQTKKVIHRRKR